MVHESHIIVSGEVAGVRECLRCFACTCHYDHYLAVPCVAFDREWNFGLQARKKKVASNGRSDSNRKKVDS